MLLASLTPFAAGGGTAYAEPSDYVPRDEVSPGYEGALTWKDYTPPLSPIGGIYIPFMLDMDADDNVYVTKFSYHLTSPEPSGKVEKISNDGQRTDTIYDADLHYPAGIAVDPSGNVYVADNSKYTPIPGFSRPDSTWVGNTARILKFPPGATPGTYTPDDIAEGAGMHAVLGIATDSQGNVYAVDSVFSDPDDSTTPAPKIWKLTNGSTEWSDITGLASPLENPFDIAVDGEGNVFVTDIPSFDSLSAANLFKLGAKDGSWTSVTPTAGQAPFIAFGLDVDPYDNVLAADLISGSVRKLKYGQSSDDWSTVEATPGSGGMLFDVAADKYGYQYSVNFERLNVVRLMAAVTYDGNGGSGAAPTDDKGYKPGEVATVLGQSALTKSGEIFGGWNTESDGSGTAYAPGDTIALKRSVTLYAVWLPASATFTVTYSAGIGGTFAGAASETVAAGGSPASVPTVTPNPGYTFLGWSSDGGTTLLSSSELGAAAIFGNKSYTAYYSYQAPSAPTVSRLELDSASYSLSVGETHQTVVTAVYSDDSKQPLLSGVTFSSDKPAIASVSPDTGLVNANASGEAVITAVYGSHQAKANVTVIAPLTPTDPPVTPGNPENPPVTPENPENPEEPGNPPVTPENPEEPENPPVTPENPGSPENPPESPESPTESPNQPSTTGSTGVTGTTPPGVKVIVDGVEQERLAAAEQDTIDGRTVTKVVLDSRKIIDKLARENNKLLTIPISGNSQVVVGLLTGSLVKAMETNAAEIRIVTDRAAYTLPAAQLDIDSISAQIGLDAKLEDITIQIQIIEASGEKAAQVQAAAEREGYRSIVHPVDFEITATYGAQVVQANRFNSYVERMIALPEGIDSADITTGVVLTQGGELFHVPTVVIRQNGVAYAVMNSLTNSTYSVIYNPSEMVDVAGHWANAEVNDMASRLIVEGVSATEFRPDASVTRAEFAAIVTRGLGIQGAPYADAFADVDASDWYAGAVQAAVDYGLIDGYEEGAFRPKQRISRQEAAVVLSRASAIAKLKSTVLDAEADRALSAFADGGEVAGWARANVAAAVELGLINGRGDRLDVAASLTRAETAVLVRRLLQAADLINR